MVRYGTPLRTGRDIVDRVNTCIYKIDFCPQQRSIVREHISSHTFSLRLYYAAPPIVSLYCCPLPCFVHVHNSILLLSLLSIAVSSFTILYPFLTVSYASVIYTFFPCTMYIPEYVYAYIHMYILLTSTSPTH